MSDKCVWKQDEVSDRAWFVPPHEGEDDEPPEVQHVWSFCPFCGKPLGFESAPETDCEHEWETLGVPEGSIRCKKCEKHDSSL